MNGSSHRPLEPGFTMMLTTDAASVWLRTEAARAACEGDIRPISMKTFAWSLAPMGRIVSRSSVAVRSTKISPALPV